MSCGKRENSHTVIPATSLILDVEGTTTSISFVKDVLFPYVRKHLDEFVEKMWGTTDFEKIVQALRSQAKEYEENKVEGVVVIPETGEKESIVKAFIDNVLWLMDNDKKTKSLKDLQGLIMEEGYRKGELKGHIYDDVEPSLRAWTDKNKAVYIYSSGSVQAQKLLFGHSEKGDLLPFINGHFDTTVGMKSDPQSYKNILTEISLSPSEVAFLTDVPKEAKAAKEAGMTAILLSREGNAPLSDEDTKEFAVITSFEEIEFESNKKIKIVDESYVSDQNKKISTYTTSVDNDNKPNDPKVATNNEVEKMDVDDSPIKEVATAKDIKSKLDDCGSKEDNEDAKCDKILNKVCPEQKNESTESAKDVVVEESCKGIISKKEAENPVVDETVQIDTTPKLGNQPNKTDQQNQTGGLNGHSKHDNEVAVKNLETNAETETLGKESPAGKNEEAVLENNETTQSDIKLDVIPPTDVKVNSDLNKDTESKIQSEIPKNELLKVNEKAETKLEVSDSSTDSKKYIKPNTAEHSNGEDLQSGKMQDKNTVATKETAELDTNQNMDQNKEEITLNAQVLQNNLQEPELEEKQISLSGNSVNVEIKKKDCETNVPTNEIISVPGVNIEVGLSSTNKTSQENCSEAGDVIYEEKETLDVGYTNKAKLNGKESINNEDSSKADLSGSGDSVNGKSSQEDTDIDYVETSSLKNKSPRASLETVVEA